MDNQNTNAEEVKDEVVTPVAPVEGETVTETPATEVEAPVTEVGETEDAEKTEEAPASTESAE